MATVTKCHLGKAISLEDACMQRFEADLEGLGTDGNGHELVSQANAKNRLDVGGASKHFLQSFDGGIAHLLTQ